MTTESFPAETGAAPRGDARAARRQQALHQAQTQRAWAARHPQLAADEKAIRKGRRAAIARWGHKANGTIETHDHASQVRQGALARLYQSGAIDAHQLAYGAQIAAIAERIAGDVMVRTASLETRVDSSRHHDAFFESLGAVWNEVAYSRWRAALGAGAACILDIIVRDVGIGAAARRHRTHARRVRAQLIAALDLWDKIHGEVRREIDPATVAAAHAGIL
jgi:hypothetical protein